MQPARHDPFPIPTTTVTGETIRLAFVGQTTYFAACALDGRTGPIDARFIDFREGASTTMLVQRLLDASPDAVIVFKPELIPHGLFADLDAITIGFITEPMPGRENSDAHPDLYRRLQNFRAIDTANFDRIVSFDPDVGIPEELGFTPWRALPLPVADRYFRAVPSSRFSGRAVFIGRSTGHRERILTPAKHVYDLLHIAHGVGPDELERVLAHADVGINVHNEDYSNFENRASLHLASGHLLVSERLRPTYGLEPGLDYLEIDGPDHLLWVMRRIESAPDLYRRVRLRGRMKAELFRASSVYRALLEDLRRDLDTFGTHRSPSRTDTSPTAAADMPGAAVVVTR